MSDLKTTSHHAIPNFCHAARRQVPRLCRLSRGMWTSLWGMYEFGEKEPAVWSTTSYNFVEWHLGTMLTGIAVMLGRWSQPKEWERDLKVMLLPGKGSMCRVHICIWILQFKSNILSSSISFQFYQQTSKTTQIYSFYFSCIFTDIISMSLVFSMLYVVWRFVSFASVLTIWFWVKEVPTDTSALPDNLATRWLRR